MWTNMKLYKGVHCAGVCRPKDKIIVQLLLIIIIDAEFPRRISAAVAGCLIKLE